MPRGQMNQNSSNPTEELTETVQPNVSGVDHIQSEELTEGLMGNETNTQNGFNVRFLYIFIKKIFFKICI